MRANPKLRLHLGWAGVHVTATLLTAYAFHITNPLSLIFILLSKVLAFRISGLYRHVWNSTSLEGVTALASASVASAALTCLVVSFVSGGSRGAILAVDWLITVNVVAAAWAVDRYWHRPTPGKRTSASTPALIYGAGAAGVMLLRELQSDPGSRYDVRGFVDDDPRLTNLILRGVKVLCTGVGLPAASQTEGVAEVLVALPSAEGERLRAVLNACRRAGLTCRVAPKVEDLIGERSLLSQLRPVQVSELLGRRNVELDDQIVRGEVENSVVLVTGAAGSIGSELCVHLAAFHPRAIVAYDHAETPLFELAQRFRRECPEVTLHLCVGSVQNYRQVLEVFNTFQPVTVFHAAAYKHVPLMEEAVLTAIENNVMGTYHVAKAALKAKVSRVVLISTDKAVRPTNVMGLTKRASELVICGYRGTDTIFCAVRFGNVLGSNGSVVPIFREQIKRGGPVTVTDPEVKRFLMTIPEAVDLVLQASVMGKGGEVFVLDMGQQVKIEDLAKDLITLSGLRPGVDIKIEYTGLRPGEKLYEELYLEKDERFPTSHEKICMITSTSIDSAFIEVWVQKLLRACGRRDSREALSVLRELVPEYSPGEGVLERMRTAPCPLESSSILESPADLRLLSVLSQNA